MPTLTLPGNFDRLVTDLTVNSNGAGVETQLTALILPLNSLQVNGQIAWYHGFVALANNGNTKTVIARVTDGTNTYNITTTSGTVADTTTPIDIWIWRVSDVLIHIEVNFRGGWGNSPQFLLSQTVLSLTANALTVSLRGNGAGAADVSQKAAFLAVWR